MEGEETAAAGSEDSAGMEDKRSQDVKTLFVAVAVVRDS
jgi:hypothetical protein